MCLTLPPEILDKILEHVFASRFEGERTLIACALVATWWTGPSQRLLFSSVVINGDNYWQWTNGVLSGSETHLLEYARSLTYHRGHSEVRYRMRDLLHDFGECFSALRSLHSLELYDTEIDCISQDQFHACFSAFHETLDRKSVV